MKLKFSLFSLIFSCCFALIIVSCGEDGNITIGPTTNPPTGTPTEPELPTVDLTEVRGMIASNLANNLIIPAYENLSLEVDDLVAKVEVFNANPTEENLLAAQDAVKNSRLAWQSAAIYMFGPAEEIALRKSLNTYPTDANQIEANIETGDYILSSLANQAAVGFQAIAYLVHAETSEKVIEQFTSMPQANSRKQYLLDLVSDIQTRVNSALDGWNNEGGNYLTNFTEEAALGIDVGSSLSIIVNSIDLHFQRFTRDGKVAIPAGVRSAGVPRPKAVEAFYGGYSVELLQASILAYEQLFLGIGVSDVDGESLYDYLVAIDAKDLGDDIVSQFAATQNAVSQLVDPLGTQIETDLESLTTVFLEMQKLVVFFKSDMASLMGISITNQDNDGD